MKFPSSYVLRFYHGCSKEWMTYFFRTEHFNQYQKKQKYLLTLYKTYSDTQKVGVKHDPTLLIGNNLNCFAEITIQRRNFSTFSSRERHIDHEKHAELRSPKKNKLHAAPKNVLHNAYDVIAQELKDRELKLSPHFTIVKEKNHHSWNCTYNIKWPQSLKFVSSGQTKQEASHKAALSVLLWLQKEEKITEDGNPILIGKNERKEISQKALHHLNLDGSVLSGLQAISDIYEHEFLLNVSETVTNENQNGDELGQLGNLNEPNDVHFQQIKPRMFGSSKYLAKEKIHLPISDYKQQFIDLLRQNRVVIIQGEPGCGKSTRIPQYVLESWAEEAALTEDHCRIVVTQPRRIAAISLANRVSHERDEQCGHIVGYQVRLNSKFNPGSGRILYCTTGILLRHLQYDLTLSNFSHVILDEAHERDVNTDLLMNLLRNTLNTNTRLKLIIMSATIDTNMFKNYFTGASVMHIPGFTYPVKCHFLDDLSEIDLGKTVKACGSDFPSVVHEDVVKVIDYIHTTKDEGAILCFLPGWEDISRVNKLIPSSDDMVVLNLHSRLRDSDQRKIFSRPPPGIRKVILATNIAETSVTIDDVVYVIDPGIHKENRFDSAKGVMCIDNFWISKSNMIQRKGRAGRVQPGESFHLYPRSKYESFAKFSDPEILKTSLTKIVLNSKAYSNNMDALQFMSGLPSPPGENATKRAVMELKEIELLDENENLTPLGKTLANFQLEPKLAKVLINSVIYKCVTPVVDIITLFSSDTELFGGSLFDKENIRNTKIQNSRDSDHLAVMRLFERWLDLMETQGVSAAESFCYNTNLVHHKLITMNKLRKIHFDYLHNGLYDSIPISDDYSDNDELVKAVLLSGVGTVLKRYDWDIIKGRYKKKNVFLTSNNHKVSVTPDSVNCKKNSFSSDVFVYFNELRSNIRRISLVRDLSLISPLTALLFSPKRLTTKNVEDDEKILIGLRNTKVEYLCTRKEADDIRKCKEALNSMYQYLIYQVTTGGEYNSKVDETWNKILQHVSNILLKYCTKHK